MHEWAWSDRNHRTVCGLTGQQLGRAEVVSDLGQRDPSVRCRNCERMRAAVGTSSKPVVLPGAPPSPELAELAAGAAARTTVSERELEILTHTTGWHSRWPLYRNHFCAGPSHDDWNAIQAMIERGLMQVTRPPSGVSGGDFVFGATAIGIAALKGRGKQRSEPSR